MPWGPSVPPRCVPRLLPTTARQPPSRRPPNPWSVSGRAGHPHRSAGTYRGSGDGGALHGILPGPSVGGSPAPVKGTGGRPRSGAVEPGTGTVRRGPARSRAATSRQEPRAPRRRRALGRPGGPQSRGCFPARPLRTIGRGKVEGSARAQGCDPEGARSFRSRSTRPAPVRASLVTHPGRLAGTPAAQWRAGIDPDRSRGRPPSRTRRRAGGGTAPGAPGTAPSEASPHSGATRDARDRSRRDGTGATKKQPTRSTLWTCHGVGLEARAPGGTAGR